MNNKMYKLKFIINKNDVENFSDELFSKGAQSISTRHEDEKVELTVLCEDRNFLEEYRDLALSIDEIQNEDWKYNWLENFEGFEINNSIYILPVDSNKKLEKNYEHVIILDPRDAFGDGGHPTTRMCLELLQNYVLEYKQKHDDEISLLDIGTGTGILSILAAKLGVDLIDAIDNEFESISKSKENMSLNKFKFNSLLHLDIANFNNLIQYDIVIANLLTDILEKNIHLIKSLMKQNGLTIISGIGKTWEKEIETILDKNKLLIKEKSELDGWLAYVLR